MNKEKKLFIVILKVLTLQWRIILINIALVYILRLQLFPLLVTKEDVKEKRYMKKRVIYIQPKLKNKKYYDRLGTVEY